VEEEVLMESPKKLASDWKKTYMTHFFPGFHDQSTDRDKLCQEYLYGIQWIWAYYTGKLDDVCFNWYYPFSLPPLWCWIHAYLTQENVLPVFPNCVLVRAQDIRPVEQLALVLPLASWSLLPSGPEKKLPYLAPYLFPESFGFDTVGKRFFWECESIIPLPSIHTLKEIIRSHA
jgi:5'-3' exonuclease